MRLITFVLTALILPAIHAQDDVGTTEPPIATDPTTLPATTLPPTPTSKLICRQGLISPFANGSLPYDIDPSLWSTKECPNGPLRYCATRFLSNDDGSRVVVANCVEQCNNEVVMNATTSSTWTQVSCCQSNGCNDNLNIYQSFDWSSPRSPGPIETVTPEVDNWNGIPSTRPSIPTPINNHTQIPPAPARMLCRVGVTAPLKNGAIISSNTMLWGVQQCPVGSVYCVTRFIHSPDGNRVITANCLPSCTGRERNAPNDWVDLQCCKGNSSTACNNNLLEISRFDWNTPRSDRDDIISDIPSSTAVDGPTHSEPTQAPGPDVENKSSTGGVGNGQPTTAAPTHRPRPSGPFSGASILLLSPSIVFAVVISTLLFCF